MFHLYRKMRVMVSIVLCLLPVVYGYSGGGGTSGNPYQIASVSDWNDLTKTSSDWNKYFIMTADVNLQGLTLTPVGSSATNFTGVLEGNDYIIYNVDINMPTSNYIGLFGFVGLAGQILNLSVEDVNISGGTYVGGLAGYNNGRIDNCYVAEVITKGNSNLGGLAGLNDGELADCYADGVVAGRAGSSRIGGLTGENGEESNFGVITDCYADCEVSGGTYVGGLAGYNYQSSTITGCCAAGIVTGTSTDTRVGGLAGYNRGTITDCYAAGAVSGNRSVGGFAGYQGLGSINNSYSTGAVSGSSTVGGFLGYKPGGTVNNCVWDVNTSGWTTSAAGTGKTTSQMRDINTFLVIGWDFLGETANGTEDDWRMCVSGIEYPKLSWQFLLGDFVCPDGVNFGDFACLAQWWMRTDCAANNDCNGTDITADGAVDFLDCIVFAENWLQE